MKLIAIKTCCFKKLGDFSADFTDGLNVIAGENAQGKSTLLRAIGFALYGTEAVQGKEADFRTWGETRPYSAELKFEHKGSGYVALRSKDSASIHRDGELVANGKTECSKFITELLGINWKDFKTFVLSSQFSTFAVLEEGATSLNRKVEERSGITIIDSVQSKARRRARDLELQAARYEDTEQELKEYDELIERAESAYADLQKELNALEKPEEPKLELPEAPTLPTQLVKERAEYDAAVVRLANATEALETAEKQLKSVEENKLEMPSEDAEPRAVALVEDSSANLHELQQQKALLTHQLGIKATLETEIARLEPRIITLLQGGDESARLEQIESLKDKASALRGDRYALEASLAENGRLEQSLRETLHNAVCPTCKQAIADLDIEKTNARIAEVADLISSLRTQHSSTEAHEAEVEKLVASHTSEYEKLCTLQETHTKQSEKLDGLSSVSQQAVDDLNTEMGYLQANIESYLNNLSEVRTALRYAKKSAAQIEQAKKDHAQAVANRDAAESHLQNSTVVTDADVASATEAWNKYEQLRSEQQKQKDAYNALLREYEREYVTKESLLRRCGHDLDNSKAGRESAKKDLAEQTRLLTELDRCKRLSQFLAARRPEYLNDVWSQIMAVASSYVNSATSGSISRVVYEDGGFKYDEGGLLPDVSNASGAQMAFIGIAVRIGLSRVLYGDSSLLIFDEPTESMSETNAQTTVAALATAAKQVFVITHKQTDQDLANNVINL